MGIENDRPPYGLDGTLTRIDARDPLTASTEPESSAGTLKQECVEGGLVKPKITRSVMKHPGHLRGRTQEINVDAEFLSMPDECEGHFERQVGFKARLTDEATTPLGDCITAMTQALARA
jgi:hypothetical protein